MRNYVIATSFRARGPATKPPDKSSLFPIRKMLGFMVASFALAMGSATPLRAQTYPVNFSAATLDKWNYPFASNAGATRTTGLSFGAFNSAGQFDARDAEFYAGFNTSGIVPTGLGASSYVINSVTFTLSIATGDGFVFDPTYDSIGTYDVNGNPVGDDAGRPIELYGAAFRNGFTATSYVETSPIGASVAGVPTAGIRNAYPTDFVGATGINAPGTNRDVANNLITFNSTPAFNPIPFAIGQVAAGDLNGDGTVKAGANVVFSLNLANPDVVRYLQLSFDLGQINFLATSLHQAAQGGPTVYPEYYTKENLVGGLPGRLSASVSVVPEPGTWALIVVGIGLLAFQRRQKQKGC